MSGTIYQATGTFDNVSSGITETGQFDGQGPQEPNEFSLQLNSEFFSSPACSGSSDPSNCLGWEQFVYSAGSHVVYMQYWLIGYDATCPSGWFSYSGDCYTNSAANVLSGGELTAADLATVQFVGSANSGGDDQVTLSLGSGSATMVSNNDDVVDLADHWNTTEFDVFGDGGGGQANFGPDTTLDPHTALVASSQQAPSCVDEGFTAETNNLDLTGTPALGAEPSPTIESAQTNGTTTAPSCATAAGSGPTPTATALSVAPASPTTNDTVTLTATVAPSALAPTGAVAFMNGGTVISGCAAQPVALHGASYTATCATSFTAASSPESLSATFTPSNPSLAGSTSPADSLTVVQDSTTTSLTASATQVNVGESVTYTATVTPAHSGAATPSGLVDFFDDDSGEAPCAAQPVSGGRASCTVSYGFSESHTVTASYEGDGNFSGSASGAVTVSVSQPVPVASSPPTISGTPIQGQALRESHGTWSNGPISYGYQWEVCNGSGAGCSAIPGATSPTLNLGSAEVGHTIRVLETAGNAAGAGIAASSGATAIVAKSSAQPTGTQVRAAIHAVLAPSGKTARIGALLKAGGYTYRFAAPSAGTLVLDWYATVKGKKVLIAEVTRVIHSAGRSHVKLKLTAKGRRLLKSAKKLKVLGSARFTPTGETGATATRHFTVKR